MRIRQYRKSAHANPSAAFRTRRCAKVRTVPAKNSTAERMTVLARCEVALPPAAAAWAFARCDSSSVRWISALWRGV